VFVYTYQAVFLYVTLHKNITFRNNALRPVWLDLAHKKLDESIFAAYGWPPDLSDEEILKRLLELNLERAERE